MKASIFSGAIIALLLAAFWLFTPDADHVAAESAPVRPLLAQRPAAPGTTAEARNFAVRMAEWAAAADPYRRNRIESELEASLNGADAAAIAQALSPALLETPMGLRVLARWAHQNRSAALQWLARQPSATPFQIATVVRGWAASAPEDLHRYLNAQPPGEWRERVLAAVGNDALVSQDAEEAIFLAQAMERGEDQTRLIGMAVFQWARWDPNAAAEYTRKVGDPELRKTLVPKVAAGYAASEPADAAQWLMESLPPGEELDRGIGNILQIWIQEFSSKDATDWVEKLPAGDLRESARASLANAQRIR